MVNSVSSTDSKSLNEPATGNSSLGPHKAVKFSEPPNITKSAEESRPQHLNKQSKDQVPRDPSETVMSSQPQIVKPPEENLNEQAKDSEPQDQPTQDHGPQDLNEPYEESTRPDLSQLAPDSTAQDLETEAEAQRITPQKTLLGEESLLPSDSNGQEITTTDDVPAPEPSLDDGAQGPAEPATDGQPQDLEALTEAGGEEPEQCPQDEEVAPSPIFMTGVWEKTLKTERGGAHSSSEHKKNFHSSPSTKPMFSWTPPQFAKATLGRKPRKPQTADKATQILPGRVPMFTKLPPQRVLPPKPKRPSADKATEITPSFEKLLKRPPPLVIKKKTKKQDTHAMTMTKVYPQASSSSHMPQTYKSHYGRSPRGTADSPSLHVKSLKSRPLHVKSLKRGATRVKSLKSGPVHMKSTKSSMPLLLQMSSSSPSKHRLNLSFCPRRKQKLICNLHITFCDSWEEPNPCCVQQTLWEESLPSCSGLCRACSVFSLMKYGRINVSNLLLALHTLGILVTSGEMRHILRLVDVDEYKTLNFCEFLEAVNITSPFAEIAAFQNTLQAFRKMKMGTVTVKELEPILYYLGITLCPETAQQTLRHIKVNKNGRFDISDFLLAAKNLQRILEEEEEEEEAFLKECAIFKRRPFQDVANLVDVECRRRRKYCDWLDEEAYMPTCLFPPMRQQESDEDAALGKQQSMASNTDLRQSSTVSPVNITKEEAKDGNAMEVTTSQMALSSDLKSSSHESLLSNEKGENKDNNAMEMGKSQPELPSQNLEDPVPS